MLLTVSALISSKEFPVFTITAIPSNAIAVDVKPAPVSVSFNSREAIPISQVPSAADVIPVVESLSCTSISAPLFTAL